MGSLVIERRRMVALEAAPKVVPRLRQRRKAGFSDGCWTLGNARKTS